MTEEEVERAHDAAAAAGPKKPEPGAVEHYASCRADYPEKPEGEAPRELQEVELEDGYTALVCKDCGASVNNLPPLEDPYWDDVREEIEG